MIVPTIDYEIVNKFWLSLSNRIHLDYCTLRSPFSTIQSTKVRLPLPSVVDRMCTESMPLRAVANASKLSERVGDIQAFLDDLIKVCLSDKKGESLLLSYYNVKLTLLRSPRTIRFHQTHRSTPRETLLLHSRTRQKRRNSPRTSPRMV